MVKIISIPSDEEFSQLQNSFVTERQSKQKEEVVGIFHTNNGQFAVKKFDINEVNDTFWSAQILTQVYQNLKKSYFGSCKNFKK